MIKSTNVFEFSMGDELAMQRLVKDDRLMINRLVVPSESEVPAHTPESSAYFIVTDGMLSLALNGEPEQEYPTGTIVSIAAGSMLAIANRQDSVMRMFVIKTHNDGC